MQFPQPEFALEIHPPDWRFPAGKSWIAGWIKPAEGDAITEMRAWLDRKPFLGLHGLPRPVDGGLPYTGFSFLLSAQRNAALLRLEARDLSGRWFELFRTPITVAADSPPSPMPVALADNLPSLVSALLRRIARQPERNLATLADETLAASLSEPLDSLPNPPFAGALEEPTSTGRVEHGRLSVTGWLTHRSAKIARLTAILDPLREVPLPHGLIRADIAGNFPELAQHANSAFVGQVDLPAGMSTPVLLKIFAELDNGEQHLAFAQRFNPRVPAGVVSTVPTVSGFQFARAVWALGRAARRHGVPTAGCFRAGLAALAPYPAKSTGSRSGVRPASSGDRPLRILVVTHNLNFEGAPRLVLELSAFFLRQPGISVGVISPMEGPLRRQFEAAGMTVTVLDLAHALRAASTAEFHAALDKLGQTIDWSAVDLVLANTVVSFWAVHLARRAGKPAVLYVHESSPVQRLFAPLVAPGLFPVIEETFALAQRVIFTADASRQIFAPLDRLGNFLVLPSWLDVAGIRGFCAQNEKVALRVKHGFAPDSVLLLNLGTVCERKGQHTFVQAAARLEPELRARHPARKIEFVMVGTRNDDFLRSLQSQVAEARLQHVRFVPETRENFDFHRLADIFVCTSFEESSPRVLLEAAAFGTPIVSTDVNGIPELLSGRDAWLVEPGDHYLLAAAIRQALAAHFAGDTRRADRARARVAERYHSANSLPRHLAVVREAAAILRS